MLVFVTFLLCLMICVVANFSGSGIVCFASFMEMVVCPSSTGPQYLSWSITVSRREVFCNIVEMLLVLDVNDANLDLISENISDEGLAKDGAVLVSQCLGPEHGQGGGWSSSY